VLLISQLKHAAQETEDNDVQDAAAAQAEKAHREQDAQQARDAQEAARAKSRIMQRILVNDAEIRHLAEPWLQDLGESLAGRRRTLH